MSAKICIASVFVFCCLAVSACARSPGSVNFPDSHIYGDYNIDHNEQNAVPIKVTYVIGEDDDKAPPVKTTTPYLSLIYTSVDKTTGFAFASATGVVISHDGYILTNHHVIENNPLKIQVMVGANSKTAVLAVVVADDPINDLAIIKVNHAFANIAHFGSADDIRINQNVYYWGYPYGLSSKSAGKCFHRGYISRLNVRDDYPSLLPRFFMGIRGAPGVSGSAIYGTDGRVIGVIRAYTAGEQHFVAIPVDQVTTFLSKNHIPFSN